MDVMKIDLAIVIPAFKREYLAETLTSLACQSCQDFTLYIGDDASPDNLKDVVDSFRDKLGIVYHRFDENLGGKNLTAHWMRCLEMVRDETWVWMFSDDDIAQSHCVEAFYNLTIPDDINVLHFNLDIIGKDGKLVRKTPEYPSVLFPQDFFNMLYRRKIDARMQEFVFRSKMLKEKGFVPFDLAWRTDNATVMNLSYPAGVLTIQSLDSRVQWRAGLSNISVNPLLSHRKNIATVNFFNWVDSFFERNSIKNPMSPFYELKTIVFQLEYDTLSGILKEGHTVARQLAYSGIGKRLVFRLLLLYRMIYRE